MRLLTLIVLFLMQIVTSWTYLSSLKSWDSFAQRPQKVDYRDFLEYEAVDIDSLAVVSATSEEAAWLAGLLSKNSFKAYSLGIGNQALGEALSRNCNLTYAQENFDQIDAIILDRRLSDISNIYMFENKAFDAIRHWDIYRAEELKFAVTVNGSGTFPPNVLSRHQSPIEGSSVIRWSSGQICLGVYSSRDIKVELNIRLARGPDLSAFEKWDIQAPIETSEYTFADGTLALEVSAKKGWNRVQIIQRGCENNPNYSRFFARPDDRKLCFAVGKISVNP
jgi:hypothetical protein